MTNAVSLSGNGFCLFFWQSDFSLARLPLARLPLARCPYRRFLFKKLFHFRHIVKNMRNSQCLDSLPLRRVVPIHFRSHKANRCHSSPLCRCQPGHGIFNNITVFRTHIHFFVPPAKKNPARVFLWPPYQPLRDYPA